MLISNPVAHSTQVDEFTHLEQLSVTAEHEEHCPPEFLKLVTGQMLLIFSKTTKVHFLFTKSNPGSHSAHDP
jgi:hypothetical protein